MKAAETRQAQSFLPISQSIELGQDLREANELVFQSNLTTAQLLLWLGQKLYPQVPLYNMAFLFTLEGEISSAHFQAAFQCLMDRSDALRTAIDEHEGIPQQRLFSAQGYTMPLLDFSHEGDPLSAAQIWTQARTQRVFELTDCLFDTALIKLAPDRYCWYLNQHHLITDIWSVKLIFERMAHFYRHSLDNSLETVQTQPIDAEFTAQENHQIDFPIRVVEHWQQVSIPESIALYHQMATQVSPQTHRVSYELGQTRTNALKHLAITSEAQSLTPQLSLFNLIATALFAYLYRVSGNPLLAIATPAHGRPTQALKEKIGVFIELFPLQTEIDTGETFASLLTKVSQASGLFLRYAQPGASRLALKREINVVLNFIHASLPDFDGLEVQSDWVHAGAGDPRHHLRLQVHDFDARGSLQLHFDFNCDLFDESLQKRAVEHFVGVLDTIIADREQKIDGVNLLSDPERHHLLSILSGDKNKQNPTTEHQDTRGHTVVQCLENQVTLTPDNIAVVCDGESLTYQQLNERANQLAHWLQHQGVVAETPVALFLSRSLEMLIALWSVLKAGGTYVPIEPSYPTSRVDLILQDTGALIILTQAKFSPRLPPTPATIIALDSEWNPISTEPCENLSIQIKPDQLAYILYTSGSTGQPKGVQLEHRGLANYVLWATQEYGFSQPLAFPLFSQLTFDLTVTSIYVPLISGGQVVIYPEEDGAIDLSIQRIFKDNSVDVIKLTPAHLALVQEMPLGTRVKALILGGENLTITLARSVVTGSDRPIKLYNEYGPTEATVGCMTYLFNPHQDTGASVPIGRPAAQAQIYLLDDQLNLVPQGALGEIFIGGPGLARGYLNRLDLTAERFVNHPFVAGERLYRTGDLGRWQENGNLQYLGRCDRQVKIRGTRIELGEIEATLSSHPNLSVCVIDVVQPKLLHQPDSKPDTIIHCIRCGLASNYPGVKFDRHGVCDICHSFETYRHRTEQYFKPLTEFQEILDRAKQRKQGQYDCMMLLSGGKDSTYALCQLVNMGYQVFAFTLDNGYISEEAKANIGRVVTALNVDHTFGTTPAMNQIFVDSLQRHCNVCNGCFKTIYTLGMTLAYEQGIRCIVTGLSRGQFFETRLTEEWFTDLFGQEQFEVEQIDQTILSARKTYHRTRDAVAELLDVEVFKTDDIFEAVEIVDFYRYCDVCLDEMLAFLREQAPWIRPSDTGRSTNCLINDVGISVHRQKRGYHNYALPYSWDVRLGHKTLEAAIHELNDEIDLAQVERILQEVGYTDWQDTDSQLVAYYVSNQALSTAELRNFLAQRLPGNMVPAHFVALETIPLTANGKVDFAVLPDPWLSRPALTEMYIAPQTPLEQALVTLWQQVLKVNRIGVQDNFFDLGGDSIMAIQIAARMADTGFSVTPNQIFLSPTIAALATAATPISILHQEQGSLNGEVLLTPIQIAFFEQNPPEPHHFNQWVLLDVDEILDADRLSTALDHLVSHHDSLRLSYIRDEKGWTQQYRDSPPPICVNQVDLSQQSAQEQAEAIATTTQIQTQLQLESADLLRVALFDLGESEPNQLLLVIHHLVVDGVSWLILLEDLETIYRQLNHGEFPSLPTKTSSFKTWSKSLSQVKLLPSEIDHWLISPPVPWIPFDPISQNNKVASAKTLTVFLEKEYSQSLFKKVLQTYHNQVHEILLTALTLAVSQRTGQSSVHIDLEGHGREETIVPGVNLVRTVGWFTSLFPVILTAMSTPGEAIQAVKETLRHVPNRGIGYGILRYLQHHEAIASLPQAPILFNYLGTIEDLLPNDSMFRFAKPLAISRSPAQGRSHPLEINAVLVNGQLQVEFCYGGLTDMEISSLADEFLQQLKVLIDHCLSSDAGGVTATDFPLAKLDNKKLSKLSSLLEKADNVERMQP